MSELRDRMRNTMELRGYSPSTIKSYIDCVARYSRHYSKSPKDLRNEDIRSYLTYLLKEKTISTSGMNQAYSSLKVIYTMVLEREWDATIPRMKRVKSIPVVLSKNEVQEILSVHFNIKHRIILKLLYSAGLRISELRNLKITDIDSKRKVIRIKQGKGKKDRYTILSKFLLLELRAYWQEYRPKIWLFNGADGGKYSTRSVQHIFVKAKKKARITKECSCHTLRHSFATHLLEIGTDIFTIKELLGHSSIKTTTIYLHISNKHIKSIEDPLKFLNRED